MNAAPAVRDGLYIGLISGTSMDGVDAVLAEFTADGMRSLCGVTASYPPDLGATLHTSILPDARLSLHDIATLHIRVGEHFAAAATQVCNEAGVAPATIVAIGSHGQTLCHAPRGAHPYTMQIGNAATIAARSGLTTVADFRSLDIAYGGEGAPLVPAFHEWLLRDTSQNRVIVNIGGIANISLLPADPAAPLAGFDTGTGNCLMDAWCARHRGMSFDADGAWAASGTVVAPLLMRLLADPYYAAPAPKSTGRETFNLAYLDAVLTAPAFASLPAADVQATLCALTVETIARDIERQGASWAGGVYVCGGGARNGHLMASLARRLAPAVVATTATLSLDPDMVEASAFAWLAWMRLNRLPVRMTTGPAARTVLLGCVYEPTGGLRPI